jgi:hypothetical protein
VRSAGQWVNPIKNGRVGGPRYSGSGGGGGAFGWGVWVDPAFWRRAPINPSGAQALNDKTNPKNSDQRKTLFIISVDYQSFI